MCEPKIGKNFFLAGLTVSLHMAAVARKDRLILGAAVLATAIAGYLSKASVGAVPAFIASAVALSLLAVVVGEATDHLGSRMGPGATGVLQSGLGNLPELFVCIFSLRAGLVEVVKGALVGSILANSLLVLGIAMLTGGLKFGTQKFSSEPPKMIAILMLLATSALVLPTLVHELHTPASQHEVPFSLAVSIVLLLVFLCSIPFFIKGNPAVSPAAHDGPEACWSLPFSIAVLAVSGTAAAFVSEWFVDALQPATQAMGISEAFSGLVVVAIAGNAIENLVGIQLAARNKSDYAMSVILNSSLQISLALTPILVILSYFIAASPLTLVLPPLLAAGLLLSAVVSAFIVFDGESIWLEGVALIGLYAIIVSAFWWG
jgi:Ca2+:H+ antiporter